MVLWLHEQDAPRRPEDIDQFTCAEIPDKATSPKLHDLVTTLMMHGPCGDRYNKRSPCMKEGRCEKDYPIDFCQHTLFGDSVSPQYRRRAPGGGGQEAHIYSRKTKMNYKLGNNWVVPYNRYCWEY